MKSEIVKLTSLQIPDDCKVVVIINKREADSLGRLLKWAIRETQKGEPEANKLPFVAHLDSIQTALQDESYVVEGCDPWLTDAITSLERGQNELMQELRSEQ